MPNNIANPLKTNRNVPTFLGLFGLMLSLNSCAIGFNISNEAITSTITHEFTIQQEAPKLEQIDHATPGASHGDEVFFTASIKDHKGNDGVLHGTLKTISANHHLDENLVELKSGQLIFSFDNYQLIVMGRTDYELSAPEMNVDKEQVRAVVGGTGKMIGARGQVVTTKNQDGTYTHHFEVL